MVNERGTVFTISQLGVETTPGVAVAATRRIQTLKFVPKIESKTSPFAPFGYKYDTVLSVDQEWTSTKVDGIGAYDHLIYPLSGLFGVVTPSIPSGGTLSQSWVFNPNTTNPETAKTFTVESGSSVRAAKFAYGLFTEWGMTATRSDVKVNGAMIGQRVTDGVTLTAAPTEVQSLVTTGTPTGGTFTLSFNSQTTAAIVYNAAASVVASALQALTNIGASGVTCAGGALPTAVTITFAGGLANAHQNLITTTSSLTGGTAPTVAVSETTPGGMDVTAQPIFPTHNTIYVDSSAANLGVTALTRAFSFDWKISGKWGPVWPVNAANTSFAAHVETKPKGDMKLLVEADAAGMAYLTQFRAGTAMWIRHASVGPVIEGSIHYAYNADFCGKITGLSDFKDEKGVYAIEYSLDIQHDPVWGQAQAHTVVTTQVSL